MSTKWCPLCSSHTVLTGNIEFTRKITRYTILWDFINNGSLNTALACWCLKLRWPSSLSIIHITQQLQFKDFKHMYKCFINSQMKSHDNLFCSNLTSNYPYPIRSQFCTCHDSSAVMACAKLWPGLIIIVLERTICILQKIGWWIHKLFVKPVVDVSLPVSGSRASFSHYKSRPYHPFHSSTSPEGKQNINATWGSMFCEHTAPVGYMKAAVARNTDLQMHFSSTVWNFSTAMNAFQININRFYTNTKQEFASVNPLYF